MKQKASLFLAVVTGSNKSDLAVYKKERKIIADNKN